MHIAVLGASRNTGKAVVEQALERGIRVTILARSPARLTFSDEQRARLDVVEGDATVKADVARAIAGADVVVFSLGAKVGLGGTADMGVESAAAPLLLEAIRESRDRGSWPRIVMVSSTGVDSMRDVPLVLRPLYALLLRTPHRHKAAAEAAIRASGVPYTLVRPALLTHGPRTAKYRAGPDVAGYTVSRSDVAHFVLEQCVEADKWPNGAVAIAY
ncbi:hypothetical protein H4R18_002649 [Coemansia javaensis]|uniref:NAD(P)-binding domain-containing protein n=1 Tax=Coemansia javaensis TaxID=2761396 RepID=A0A9W8HHQ6_9FUNG|nr:hypothetical protein H4R18_002649 [Coemansia javaensis]